MDWIDHLTPQEATDIARRMDDPQAVKSRYPARDDRGQRTTRYSKPTAAELARIRAKAQ